MTSYIKVSVKPFEYNYDKCFEFVIPIDGGLLKEIQEPIESDFIIFSEDEKIKNILLERKIKINKSRDYWSKKLSKLITEKILNQLESDDTINRYLKKDI
jgi:hypothetical protein